MPYVVRPTDIVSVEIDGETARFPVRRIFCVGRNDVAHIREMGGDERDLPFYFTKPADTIALDHIYGYAVGLDRTRRDVRETIANLSGYFELAPGDPIYTGTP